MANNVSSRMMLMADSDLCTGCRLCEVACVLEHEGFCNTAYARLKIHTAEDVGAVDTPFICMHCPDAPCEAACPSAALWMDDEGIVQLDAAACDGCGLCARDCPHGAIFFEPGGNKIQKCDLCGGAPKCVEVCDTQALTFVERDQYDAIMARRQAEAAESGGRIKRAPYKIAIDGLKT